MGYKGGGQSNEKVKELKAKITDLETQIKLRDEQIQQITSGFIKDVTHMKEMMFRKQNIDEIEIFEVQYFDGTQNLDEQTRSALNDKLRTLKYNFEKKTKDYEKKLVFLHSEHEKLKKSYNQIAVKKGDTSEMFKKIFEAENNPYVLWKQIQEVKGNKFFFDVFERQRPEYGINYKEVNKMLMSKNAYEKEYFYYKEQNDDALCNLIKRCTGELEEIKGQITEKDEEIMQLKSEQKEDKKQKQEKMIANMRALLEQREEDLYTKFECQKVQWMNLNDEEDKQMLKLMVFRWQCVNKLIKCKGLADNEQIMKQIKFFLTKNPKENDIIKELETKLKEMEEDSKKIKSQFDQLNLQIIYEKTEREEIQAEKTVLQEEILNLRAKIQQLKEDNKNKDNQVQIYQITLSNVYKHIGLKIEDSQFEVIKLNQIKLIFQILSDIKQLTSELKLILNLFYTNDIYSKQVLNLDDENRTSTKAFKKKMSKIDKISLRRIREENILGEKVVDAHQDIFQPPEQKTQGTMTDLLNVEIPVVYQNNVDKQIKLQKKELAEQFEQQFVNLQNQMQNDLLLQQQAFDNEIQRLRLGNNQSRARSRKASTIKSEIIQSYQSHSKTSLQDQESEIADDIEPQLNQPSFLQERKSASQVYGLGQSQRKQSTYIYDNYFKIN